MTDRRSFLRSLITLGGIAVVGPDVLEALDRATHRKVWQGGIPVQPHRFSVRHGLPTVQWRLINQGVTPRIGRLEMVGF